MVGGPSENKAFVAAIKAKGLRVVVPPHTQKANDRE